MTISWLNDQFSVRSPRRSARMTHFCSLRLTHPKNTICPQARDGASNIIHAEGVRGAVSSSAPQARKVLSLREDIWARVKTAKTGSVARRGLARILPVGKKVQPGGKGVLTWPWCWVTFGEQSMVISRERRSRFVEGVMSSAKAGGSSGSSALRSWAARLQFHLPGRSTAPAAALRKLPSPAESGRPTGSPGSATRVEDSMQRERQTSAFSRKPVFLP